MRKAIAAAGYGDFEEYEQMDFVPGWATLRLNNGMELDIMSFLFSFSNADFDDCYSLAPEMNIVDIPVKVLHINHLIDEKKKRARPKDLTDVEELEKIRAFRK